SVPSRSRSDPPRGLLIGRHRLHDGSDALPHPDAHGGQAVAAGTLPKTVHQVDDEPGTAHPEWVSEGDGAAIHVDAFGIKPQLAYARHSLAGEGLVELDEVEVGDREAGTLERL